MPIPLQITFRNMDPSPAIEARIHAKAAKLERFYERIESCRVTVEGRHHHHRKGTLYNVRIEIVVPGKDVFIDHTGPLDHAHEDVYVAIRDAFNAAARRLEDHARRLRGAVKAHDAPLHGKVIRLSPDHGFIETSDGQEIYFHRNSVANDAFDRLELGAEVRLVIAEKESAAGPQATTVVPLGKHHIVG